MLKPTAGTVLNTCMKLFQWSSAGSSQFWYEASTSPGSADIASGYTTNTSALIGPFPQGLIYFRVWSRIGGIWQSVPLDITYSATISCPVYPISVNLTAGTSPRQTFSFKAGDALGANSIGYVQFLFTKSGIGALNACYISYDPASHVFYLLSDDTTQWYGLLEGSGNTIGNAQCTIHGLTSGSTKSGTDLTTNLDISFRSGFAGLKSVYQFVGDTVGQGSGWIFMGTWNDTGDPSAIELLSLTPSSGVGMSQVFTAIT
jgi:hypothetical protein